MRKSERIQPNVNFMPTQWSQVFRARYEDGVTARSALDTLCRAYWQPMYAFLRKHGHTPEDAEDTLQSFFTTLVEKRYLDSVRPEKGRFRSFLLLALKRFAGREQDRLRTRKRGGDCQRVPMDCAGAENQLNLTADPRLEPDVYFERQWASTLIERVMLLLQHEYAITGRATLFEQLHPCLTGDGSSLSYAEIAAALNVSEPAIKMAVSRMRARYRDILRTEIAATVSSPEDVDDEIRHLFALFGMR